MSGFFFEGIKGKGVHFGPNLLSPRSFSFLSYVGAPLEKKQNSKARTTPKPQPQGSKPTSRTGAGSARYGSASPGQPPTGAEAGAAGGAVRGGQRRGERGAGSGERRRGGRAEGPGAPAVSAALSPRGLAPRPAQELLRGHPRLLGARESPQPTPVAPGLCPPSCHPSKRHRRRRAVLSSAGVTPNTPLPGREGGRALLPRAAGMWACLQPGDLSHVLGIPNPQKETVGNMRTGNENDRLT